MLKRNYTSNKIPTSFKAVVLFILLSAFISGISILRNSNVGRDSYNKQSAVNPVKAVDLDAIMQTARIDFSKNYSEFIIKDSTDTATAWSIGGIAPGYDFSASVDLGKYHMEMMNQKPELKVPVAANQRMTTWLQSQGAKVIQSPVPQTYPTRIGSSNYYLFKNAACYTDYKREQTTLTLDCAYNTDFAQVAAVVKPFVSLYKTSIQPNDQAKDFAVHMPYIGKSADGSIEYAALPLNSTVAYYYYTANNKAWHYYRASATGLACNELSGTPREAFLTLCKQAS